MASFNDTFRRKEVKYVLSARQHLFLLQHITPYMALDAFGQTRITSLYFDTRTRDLIARSLEKPLYKEKLRVRWYGEPAAGQRAYIEIKKKYKGVVYKRRVGCTREAATAMLMHGVPYLRACGQFPLADGLQQKESLTKHSWQISEEIKQFVALHGPLHPSMYIQCERRAFAPVLEPSGGEALSGGMDVHVGLENSEGKAPGTPAGACPATPNSTAPASDLRITFDSGIAYRDVFAETSGAACVWRPLLEPGQVVMEIKTSGAFPFWLVDVLNACNARPSSFSKYGTAYTKVMGANSGQAVQVAQAAPVHVGLAVPAHVAATKEAKYA